MKFDVSDDQRLVLNQLWKWLKHESKSKRYITVGGYAGTGKTTSTAVFRHYLHEVLPDWKIAFISFTGKATRVLKNTLKEQKALYPDDFIGTIHSLIYSPLVNSEQEIIGWDRKEELDYQLIIIDEASMVDYQIWQDIQRYGVPIIAIGDHGQLPPIEGSFNLMENPELKLEHIHRQAEGNPIIKLSMLAREKGEIMPGTYGDHIKKIDRSDEDSQDIIEQLINKSGDDSLILCGYNRTRVQLNNFVRTSRGIEVPEPRPSDRVICLRNNHEKDIYNGMLGTIKSISRDDEHWYYAEIDLDGETELYKGLILADQFNAETAKNFTKKRAETLKGDLFDFGYALTVHKAQGSQAKRVILFEERFKQMDDEQWRRWLYTGITRAEQELYIIG